MKQEFYSNGKLLLTGEYAVLDGAKALALPTKFGQTLTVEPTKTNTLSWKSLDWEGNIWFEMVIDLGSMTLDTSPNTEIARTALKILIEAQRLNPDFLKNGQRLQYNHPIDISQRLGTRFIIDTNQQYCPMG